MSDENSYQSERETFGGSLLSCYVSVLSGSQWRIWHMLAQREVGFILSWPEIVVHISMWEVCSRLVSVWDQSCSIWVAVIAPLPPSHIRLDKFLPAVGLQLLLRYCRDAVSRIGPVNSFRGGEPVQVNAEWLPSAFGLFSLAAVVQEASVATWWLAF